MGDNKIINEYNHLRSHYKNIPQEQIDNWVHKLVLSQKKQILNMVTNCIMEGLFRARKHTAIDGSHSHNEFREFTCESQFWNPPSRVCKLGRCNDKNESIFYCSNNLTTAIVEVKPEIGEFVTVAMFKPKNPENYRGARLGFVGLTSLIKIREMQKFFGDGYEREQEEIELDEKFDELFHNDVGDDYNLYKLSLAVTRTKMTTLFDPEQKVFYEMHGMVYSSIEHRRQHFNLIYRPDHIRLHYEIAELRTYQVMKKNQNETIVNLKRIGYRHKAIILDPFDYYGLKWEDAYENTMLRVQH